MSNLLNGLRWITGAFTGNLNWTPTANRAIALPDEDGILATRAYVTTAVAATSTTGTIIAATVVNPSGVTTVDWAIPAGVRRITLVTSDLALTAGSLVRFGTGAGILSTGYVSVHGFGGGSSASVGRSTVGFLIPGNGNISNCCVVYTRGANNAWNMCGSTVHPTIDVYYVSAGTTNLPGELTTFRYVAPSNITAGSLQLLWEY